MKNMLLAFLAALLPWLPARGQSIFDSSLVHDVRITSLYGGLTDTLTMDYLLSFNFLQQQIRDIPYTYCKVELDGTPLDTIGIRYKGFNSWWSSPKKPLKLDLNRYKKGQNYQGLKKLNLHNRAGDPTFFREGLCYEILRNMGIPAPRTAFARVYFDGVYAGLYRIVEELDNGFLDMHFGDHAGNLYKQNAAGSGGYTLDWLGSTQENYYPQLQLENHNSENDWSSLVHFLDVLNNSKAAVFADSIAAVFDVQSFLRVLALDLAVNNLDFYGNSGRNYYLYHDAGGDGKIHWLPWDYNLSWRENAPPLEPDPAASAVLIRRLLGVSRFRQQFWEQYCRLREYFDADPLIPRIEADSALIRPALLTDPSGDYTLAEFEENISHQTAFLPGLKPFLIQRSGEIDQFLKDKEEDCAQVTGVQQPGNEVVVLKISPNPARERIIVQWPDSLGQDAMRLLVYDAVGQFVWSERMPEGNTFREINLAGWPAGVYLVRLECGQRRAIGRVLTR